MTANLAALVTAQWYFGEVVLQPNVASAIDAHLPLAVLPAGVKLPVRLYLPAIGVRNSRRVSQ